MSRHQLIRTLRKEIRVLNWTIDMKIVKGASYRQEARRHKLLLLQLNYLTKSTRQSIFDRMAQAASVLML